MLIEADKVVTVLSPAHLWRVCNAMRDAFQWTLPARAEVSPC